MDRASTLLSLLACAAAAVALTLAWRAEPATHPAPAGADPELGAAVRSLQQEVADLRAARPVAAPVVAPAPAEPRQPVDTASAARLAELEQRLARLEARVAALPQAPVLGNGAFDASLLPPDMQRIMQDQERRRAAAWTAQEKLRLADVAVLQSQFADTSRTEEERLQALRELRGRGKGARTGAAADTAIELVRTSTDATTRADVWRQMSGAAEPRLVPHLLLSLRADPDGKVREEAAETLGDYLKEAGVEPALRTAMDNDADPRVRSQAAQSLAGPGRR